MPADPNADQLGEAMLEEWKVIQAKIDRIGEFRFHVKNWTATIAVAFVVGAYVTDASPLLVFAALLPTWAFFLVEKRQEKILQVLMTRAERLERASYRLAESRRTAAELKALTELLGAVGSVPGVAGALRTFARSRKFDRWIFNEVIFYFILSFFIVLAGIGDIHRLRKKHTENKNRLHHIEANVVLPELLERSLERLSISSGARLEEIRRVHKLFSVIPLSSSTSGSTGIREESDRIDILSVEDFHLELFDPRVARSKPELPQ